MAADCGREVWEWCRGFLIQNKVLVDIKTNSEASRELSYCGNISPSQSEMTSPSSRAQTPWKVEKIILYLVLCVAVHLLVVRGYF